MRIATTAQEGSVRLLACWLTQTEKVWTRAKHEEHSTLLSQKWQLIGMS